MESLRQQGFRFRDNDIALPKKIDKDAIRKLHDAAVRHRLERAEPYMRKRENDLLRSIANGWEVVPELIQPRLVQVRPDSEHEILFRYLSLHWSIPVSSGYGRRQRFLVFDRQNEKVIGAFGLGDPVFNLGARDAWIGWDKAEREARLQNVMEAFLIGATPPYSYLLGGKLIAMLVASNEVRNAFSRKYRSSTRSLIRNRQLDGRLMLITTISALGRSSIYNRLRYKGRTLYESIGYTQGYGDFHFANGLYSEIQEHANKWCDPTAKAPEWGEGFRNRREVVKKCLVDLNLPTQWVHHGIRREVFAIPLASKAKEYLCGEVQNPLWFDSPAADLFAFFRERWLLPRADRDRDFLGFVRDSYRLWQRDD